MELGAEKLFWQGDPEAYVVFTEKVDPGGRGRWRRGQWNQHSVSTGGLARFLEEQQEARREELYVAIHRFYCPSRKARHVIRLGACFVDLDVGREGQMPAEEARACIEELVARRELPAPSLYQFSGRGLWAFWLLREGQDGANPKATQENRRLWATLQEEIGRRLQSWNPGLNVDPQARDLCRVTRIGGSRNRAAGRHVRYVVNESRGEILAYSLEELADSFGVRQGHGGAPEQEPAAEREPDHELLAHRRRQDAKPAQEGCPPQDAAAWGRKGHIKRWRGALEFLNRVLREELGGVIPCGQRSSTLRAFGYCWIKLGVTRNELKQRLFGLRRQCAAGDHPFTDEEVERLVAHVVEWGSSGGLISNKKLASLVGLDASVDAERIQGLGLRVSRMREGRAERTERRRNLAWDILLACWERGDELPSSRELAAQLVGAGTPASHETARKLTKQFLEAASAADAARGSAA
jgi:hypothetical protein